MDSLLGMVFLFAVGQHIFGPIFDWAIPRFKRLKRAGG